MNRHYDIFRDVDIICFTVSPERSNMVYLRRLLFIVCTAGVASSFKLVKLSQDRRPSILKEVSPFSTAMASARSDVFDSIVQDRYACKAFKRFDGKENEESEASTPDPVVIESALKALNISRLAPSAFNTQPYKLLLVKSPAQKEKLSKGCLGPNIRRVLDSDCTVVFLADKAVFRTMPKFREFVKRGNQNIQRKSLRIMQFYIMIFSSSYPLPRFLTVPISFCVRVGMALGGTISRRLFRYTLPTLANAETWTTKNSMLAGMTYMHACASRGLATIPMEGINAAVIRRALNIPSRYAIPMVVATGLPAGSAPNEKDLEKRRYPFEEVVYCDQFGDSV